MAIIYDSVGTKVDANADGTISWVHTMVGNTNSIVVASFGVVSTGKVLNSSPTYNGTAMTKILTADNGGLQEHDVWYFLSPPAGAGTIAGTWNFATTWKGGISVGYTGVNQTTPISGSATTTGNATSGSITRSISANNIWLGQISINFNKPGTTSTGIERGTVDSASREFMVADNTTGTIRWTMGGQAFAASGEELKEIAAGTNLIQSAGTSGVALTSASASWGANTTTGNMVVVGVAITNAVTLGTVTTITDTQSNTYVKAVTQAGTAVKVVDCELWYAKNIVGGAGSVTVNFGLNAASIYVREYSGLYNFLDVTSSAVGSSAAINAGTTAATAQANELIIGATADETGGTQTYQAAGAYGDMVGTTTTATGVSMYDNIVNTGGAQTGTSTMTVADEWVSVLATFKRLSNPGASFQGMTSNTKPTSI